MNFFLVSTKRCYDLVLKSVYVCLCCISFNDRVVMHSARSVMPRDVILFVCTCVEPKWLVSRVSSGETRAYALNLSIIPAPVGIQYNRDGASTGPSVFGSTECFRSLRQLEKRLNVDFKFTSLKPAGVQVGWFPEALRAPILTR